MVLKGQLRTQDLATQSKVIATANVFGSDYFVFLHKKAEKISTAVYLITNLLPDAEPVKWKLRVRSLDLIEETIAAIKERVTDQGQISSYLAAAVVAIDSLFEMSFRAGLVSEMNFTILKKELEILLGAINSRTDFRRQRGIEIPENFFGIDSRYFFRNSKALGKQRPLIAKGKMERKLGTARQIQRKETRREEIGKSKVSGDKGQQLEVGDKGQPSLKDTESVFVSNEAEEKSPVMIEKISKKNERREAVISLLKTRSYLTVNDLSMIFKDCSKKTLQRELTEMTVSGVLKREGTKRWARYLLAGNVR